MSKTCPRNSWIMDTIEAHGHFMDIIWIHFGFGHFKDIFWSLFEHIMDTFCQNMSKMRPSPHPGPAPKKWLRLLLICYSRAESTLHKSHLRVIKSRASTSQMAKIPISHADRGRTSDKISLARPLPRQIRGRANSSSAWSISLYSAGPAGLLCHH